MRDVRETVVCLALCGVGCGPAENSPVETDYDRFVLISLYAAEDFRVGSESPAAFGLSYDAHRFILSLDQNIPAPASPMSESPPTVPHDLGLMLKGAYDFSTAELDRTLSQLDGNASGDDTLTHCIRIGILDLQEEEDTQFNAYCWDNTKENALIGSLWTYLDVAYDTGVPASDEAEQLQAAHDWKRPSSWLDPASSL